MESFIIMHRMPADGFNIELNKSGVIAVTETPHDLLVTEFTFSGDFKDEDVARLLYNHVPVSIHLVGEKSVPIGVNYPPYYHVVNFTKGE